MFSTAERGELRGAQAAHMPDTCIVQTHSVTQDAHGQEVIDYADGLPIACGFGYAPLGVAPEVERADGTTVTVDAQVRLTLADGQGIGTKDRVKLTKRFGTALAPAQVYEVVGPPRVGPSGVVLQLRQVTR